MKMRKAVALCALMLIFSVSAFAQSNVKGVVTDSSTGETLIGVSVIIKGTTVGTYSEADGSYSLPAKEGDVLAFFYMGYKNVEVTVGKSSVVDVAMDLDNTFLEEVVVVGYGTQKKSDITGSVASLGKEVLEERPVPNLITALQGSVPGLRVELYGSNAEGSNNSTVIRGSNSISASNSPLIILDGAPYYNSWSELNTEDIQSVEVLKDASSTAIYGARGANGVIIITSKKGATDKVKINYHGNVTVSQAYSIPDIMDGDTFYYYKNMYVGDFTATEKDTFLSKNYVDWVGEALRTAISHTHSLSASGKTDTNNYYFSINTVNNQGIAKGNDFKKYSGRVNFEQKIGKWFVLGTNTQLNYVDRSGLYVSFQDCYRMNPLAQAYNEDGSYRLDTWEGSNNENPLTVLNADNSDIRKTVITSNYLIFNTPIKGLSYKLNTNLIFDTRLEQTYYDRTTYTGARNNGKMTEEQSNSHRWLVENILSYERTFADKHTLFLTALYSAQHSSSNSYSITGTGFANDVLTYWAPSKAAAVTVGSSESTVNHISQMFRANYSYDSRYLFTGTVRRDGYSAFGSDTKYGVFPSVAVGWNLTNESFIKGSKFNDVVTDLKLRLSWGKNGNEAISAYETLPTLSTRNYFEDDYSTAYGYYPTKLESPLLGWETTRSWNLGLDFSLLKGRINGTFDIYTARTTDLLLEKTIPSINGADSIWENLGETKSHGVEFGINSVNIDKKDFTWSTNFNITAAHTQLVDVGLYDEDGNPIDDVASGYFIGWPTNCYYDYVFDGIYQIGDDIPSGQSAGYVRYKDLNNDGSIDAENDRMVVGSREPKFDASLTNTFKWKGLSLSIYLTGRYGSISPCYLLNSVSETYMYNMYNRPIWTETNPINEYPSGLRTGGSNPMGMRWYKSADFIKLKDITLGYSFPKKLVEKIKMSKIEVYVNAKNVYTWTNWIGLDPEFVGTNSRQTSVPQTRQIIFGLKLGI